MTPIEFRTALRHQSQLALEQRGSSSPCSLRQAQFLAALWTAAFPGSVAKRKAAYCVCLAWLWGVSSARNLSTTEATVTIDWLLSGQPRRTEFPTPCAEAVTMSAAILQEAGRDYNTEAC